MTNPDEVRAHIEHGRRLLSGAFPPVALILGAYLLCTDYAFAILGFFGKRLHRRLRQLWRATYLWANLAVACALLYTLAYACVFSTAFSDGATVCTGKPLLQRHCFLATTIALLATLFAILCDRVVVPFLGIRDLGAFASRGWRDRLRLTVAVATAWMSAVDADSAALVVVGALLAQRALAAIDERAAYCAVAGHKCYATFLMTMALSGNCEAFSKRDIVGAAVAVAAL